MRPPPDGFDGALAAPGTPGPPVCRPEDFVESPARTVVAGGNASPTSASGTTGTAGTTGTTSGDGTSMPKPKPPAPRRAYTGAALAVCVLGEQPSSAALVDQAGGTSPLEVNAASGGAWRVAARALRAGTHRITLRWRAEQVTQDFEVGPPELPVIVVVADTGPRLELAVAGRPGSTVRIGMYLQQGANRPAFVTELPSATMRADGSARYAIGRPTTNGFCVAPAGGRCVELRVRTP